MRGSNNGPKIILLLHCIILIVPVFYFGLSKCNLCEALSVHPSFKIVSSVKLRSTSRINNKTIGRRNKSEQLQRSTKRNSLTKYSKPKTNYENETYSIDDNHDGLSLGQQTKDSTKNSNIIVESADADDADDANDANDQRSSDRSSKISKYNQKHHNPYHITNTPKPEVLLNYATHNLIHKIRPGTLSTHELASITGLMAQWTSKTRKTSKSNAEIAVIVEQLLKRFIDERKAGNERARATTRMYTMTIDAWSKSGKKGYAAHRAQSILDSMEQMYEEGDTYIKPDSYTYNAVLNAWSKSGERDAAMRAEAILKKMENDPSIKPDVFTYTTVIDSLKNGGRYSARRALQLLHQMQRDNNDVWPNTYTFTTVINVLGRSGDSNAVNTAIDIIEYMMQLYENGDHRCKPNILTCNGVLACIARGKGRIPASQLKAFLSRMKLERERNGFEVQPDFITYNIAIMFYCRENTLDAVYNALNLVQDMKQANISPTQGQYNAIIIAISKIPHAKSPQIANSILQQMIQSFESGEKHSVQPGSITFNACMNAYSRCRSLEAACKTEDLITQMYTLNKKNRYTDLEPNVRSYAAVLQAWARSGKGEMAANRIEEIMVRMNDLYKRGELDSPPDVYCCTIAIAAWANSGSSKAGEKAEQILDRMEELYENIKPNVRTYNAVIDTIYRSPTGDPEKAEGLLHKMLQRYENGETYLRPDTFSFNAVIQCYIKSDRNDAGEKAIAVLKKMMELQKIGIVDPDVRSFSFLIEYYSKSRKREAHATSEWLLETLVDLYIHETAKNKKYGEKLLPNSFSFTSVMMSFARASSPDAGARCERILALLKTVYASSDFNPRLKPNAFVYNVILDAYSKSAELRESAQRAEEILSLMEQEYKKGIEDMKPTAKSYISTMMCYAKSREMGKARKALNILQKMEEQYKNGNELTQPNVQAYSILINAVAFTNHEDVEEDKKSYEIAKTAMKELNEGKYDSPNCITYGTFLRACSNLNLPKEILENDAKMAFQKCCEEGQVNEYVITQLRFAVSEDLFKELVPYYNYDKNQKNQWNEGYPLEWTRNVPDKSFMIRKVDGGV